MKTLKSFLIFSIVCSVLFTSCGRKVENEYGRVSFFVENPSRQIESVEKPDFSSYDYKLTAIMGDATNPTETIVFEDGSYEDGQLLFDGESTIEIRTGTWNFRLEALFDNTKIIYDASATTTVTYQSETNISFNMVPVEDGNFHYEVFYPKEQYITDESLSVTLVNDKGEDFTADMREDEDILDKDSYWYADYDFYIPAGVYTLTIKITSSSPKDGNNVLFHKESSFELYPNCVTLGKFDGRQMDMNNSFAITVPTEVNNTLEAMGCNTITKDWYSVFESFELPTFNNGGKVLSHWYYQFDEEEVFHEIEKNQSGKFIFNSGYDIKGNVTLLFDYTLSGSSEDMVKFPQLVELENELILCSNSYIGNSNADSIIVYPMTSNGKYNISECIWELDGKALKFEDMPIPEMAIDGLIYFKDTEFLVNEESMPMAIGTWKYKFGNTKELTIFKRSIESLSFNNKLSNSYRVNLTCYAQETDGTDYGINSIIVESKVVGPITFPEDPVPEENYLRFTVLGQNKIELIDSPDYNSGTHQFDRLFAQMDGFALKKLNRDESVDGEIYYYIDSEDFAYTGDDFDVKFNVSNYFKIDEINQQYEKSGIVVAKNTNGSVIELITSNINAFMNVNGKSKSSFTFALPRREVINGTAQILDICDSVTYEYWKY